MFWREPQRFQTNRKTEDNKTPLEKCNKTLIGQTVLYLRGKPKFGICPERIQILSSKIGHNKPLAYQNFMRFNNNTNNIKVLYGFSKVVILFTHWNYVLPERLIID